MVQIKDISIIAKNSLDITGQEQRCHSGCPLESPGSLREVLCLVGVHSQDPESVGLGSGLALGFSRSSPGDSNVWSALVP